LTQIYKKGEIKTPAQKKGSKVKIKKSLDTLINIIASASIIVGIFSIFFLYLLKLDGVMETGRHIQYVTFLKDYLNAAFFLVIGVLSILSYLQARKTIFTPIKTEIFKYQLKCFEEILEYFQYKTEIDFINCFDLDLIVKKNASCLLDDYVDAFFAQEFKRDPKKWKERYKEFVGAVFSKEYAEKNLFILDSSNFKEPEFKDEPSTITNPAVILARWQEYEYGAVHYTKEYNDQIEKLGHFIAVVFD
jgi:hypothetical protein